MRIQRIIGLACVVVASSLGVACTNDNDQAQSTFHPTWDGWAAFTPSNASSAHQGAYGGGPQSTDTTPITNDNAPATDGNHGMGGLGKGTTGTGTDIDGSGPAGNHGPKAPAIQPTANTGSNGNGSYGNGNSTGH